VILQKLRERILLGKIALGTELPSTLKIADALIDLVHRQHAGKRIAPVLVHSIFEESLRTV